MIRNEQIYAALFDEEAFRNLPGLLAQAAGGRSGIVNWVHSDGATQNFAHSYFSDDFMDAYKAVYIAKDLWVTAAVASSRRNRFSNLSELTSPWRWENSEIYNELIRPSGDDTTHCIGGVFVSEWGTGLVGINRGRRAGPFEAHVLAVMNESAEALRRVLMVRGEIAARRSEADSARGALDVMGVPAIIVRGDQRVLHVNAAADVVLRRADGLVLRRGLLDAGDTEAAQRLGAAIRGATAAWQPKTAAFPWIGPAQACRGPITSPSRRYRRSPGPPAPSWFSAIRTRKTPAWSAA
jgi:hypothetical protein